MDRFEEALQTIKGELISIKADIRGMERDVNKSTDNIDNLRKDIAEIVKANYEIDALKDRVKKLEANIAKVAWLVLTSVIVAIMTLLLSKGAS